MAFSFLSDIRVLDLSQYLPGPLAGQILADLGAEVVKVEPPAGDPQRHLDPMAGRLDPDVVQGGDASPFYRVLNAGKTVTRIDLKSDDGKARFRALVEAADVLLESYRPGVMDRLGFGYADAKEHNPGLVYCALTGYGQTGPLRLAAGHDLNYMAATGALGQAGTPDGPAMAWPPMADCAGAVMSALAVLGALVKRGRDGEGAYLDVAMADCVLSWQALGLTASRLGLAKGRGQALLTGGAACYRVYACADGRELSIGNLEPVFWENFCRAVGRDDWTSRQWQPLPQDGLIADVAAHLAKRPLDHWLAALDGVDTCVQAVADYPNVAAQPQVQARGLVRDDPLGGVQVLLPILADGLTTGGRSPLSVRSADEILKDWGKA
ncbi:MAG: carnitine dehydratase [Rhodospirillales bacterium CG15_BIG_FIL_POST_REV_8_21_14_020_66_15]|nr:MAG: carnitine dehydratase [Rhodospirillales bacterium CG15_BIG_FIL_POST_REV_8_21_14_020_66_15]